MTNASQSALILKHLERGQTLTPMQALRLMKCFRLGARIYDLRRQGHSIETKVLTLSRKTRVAQYSLSRN